jgi:hypothetical protein
LQGKQSDLDPKSNERQKEKKCSSGVTSNIYKDGRYSGHILKPSFRNTR